MNQTPMSQIQPHRPLTVQQLLQEKIRNLLLFTKLLTDAQLEIVVPLSVSYVYQYLPPLLLDLRGATDGLLTIPLKFADIPLHMDSHPKEEVRDLIRDLCKKTIDFFINLIGAGKITEEKILEFTGGESDLIVWFYDKYYKEDRIRIFKYLDLFMHIMTDSGLIDPID